MQRDIKVGARPSALGDRTDPLSGDEKTPQDKVNDMENEKNQNKMILEGLMAESNSKDRELEILRKRLLMDTNELNTLNNKLDTVNKKLKEIVPDKQIVEDSDVEDDHRKDKSEKKREEINLLDNMKIAEHKNAIKDYFDELLGLRTG